MPAVELVHGRHQAGTLAEHSAGLHGLSGTGFWWGRWGVKQVGRVLTRQHQPAQLHAHRFGPLQQKQPAEPQLVQRVQKNCLI